VARYYRSDTRRNARVSTEITGYAISTFLFLYRRTQNSDYRQAAIAAGQFLIRTAWSPSLKSFPFEQSHDGDAAQPLTYFFDCGIIVRGLLDLWRETRDPEYLEIAIQTGRSMAKDFQAGIDIHPILDLPGKYPLQWGPQWSRQPGCYQLKSALGWHELSEATGDREFAKHYNAALTRALATHEQFLPAETREQTMDRLHPYCYFLEGLTPVCDRQDVRTVFTTAIEQVSEYLRDIRPEFVRSDVYAQLLRVRLIAHARGISPLNIEEASEEAARMLDFQFDDSIARGHGGFWFGRKAGELMPFLNPVSTAFSLQAFEWWQDYQAGRLDAQAVI